MLFSRRSLRSSYSLLSLRFRRSSRSRSRFLCFALSSPLRASILCEPDLCDPDLCDPDLCDPDLCEPDGTIFWLFDEDTIMSCFFDAPLCDGTFVLPPRMALPLISPFSGDEPVCFCFSMVVCCNDFNWPDCGSSSTFDEACLLCLTCFSRFRRLWGLNGANPFFSPSSALFPISCLYISRK